MRRYRGRSAQPHVQPVVPHPQALSHRAVLHIRRHTADPGARCHTGELASVVSGYLPAWNNAPGPRQELHGRRRRKAVPVRRRRALLPRDRKPDNPPLVSVVEAPLGKVHVRLRTTNSRSGARLGPGRQLRRLGRFLTYVTEKKLLQMRPSDWLTSRK